MVGPITGIAAASRRELDEAGEGAVRCGCDVAHGVPRRERAEEKDDEADSEHERCPEQLHAVLAQHLQYAVAAIGAAAYRFEAPLNLLQFFFRIASFVDAPVLWKKRHAIRRAFVTGIVTDGG
jgi:hypothetical protein